MKSRAEKVLVVEPDDAISENVVRVLSDAGYEVSTLLALRLGLLLLLLKLLLLLRVPLL
jgi:DNA-binding response OmpR family regulator